MHPWHVHPSVPHERGDWIRHARRAVLTAALALSSGCGAKAAQEAGLPHGARVRFQASSGRATWETGVVGTTSRCTVVLVPDSWSRPSRFRAVFVDSLRALRISTRFSALPGPDGSPGVYEFSADTAGEAWTEMPIASVRARYGGCSP